jgi:hypothetical protein
MLTELGACAVLLRRKSARLNFAGESRNSSKLVRGACKEGLAPLSGLADTWIHGVARSDKCVAHSLQLIQI